MKFSYTINFEDYKKATLALNNYVPTYSTTRLINSILAALFFYLTVPLSSKILSFFLSIILFVFVYKFLFDKIIELKLKGILLQEEKENNYPKDVTVKIKKSEFVYINNESHFTIPWESVTVAVETSEFYTFYVSSITTYFIFKKGNESTNNLIELNHQIKENLNTHSKKIIQYG